MKFIKYLLGLLLISGQSLHAITFHFFFDSDPNPGIQSPLVGGGTMDFATDPGDGLQAFASLGAFSMSFSFISGDTFTEAHITSDLNNALVLLSTSGSVRRLRFSDTDAGGGGGGGPLGGSIDFENASGTLLSFEPSYFGEGLRLYEIGTTTPDVLGDYRAINSTSLPDSGATAGLLGIGVLSLACARRTRRPVLTGFWNYKSCLIIRSEVIPS